jgi:hypothetical protein
MAVAATGYGKPSVSLLDSGSTRFKDAAGAYVVTGSDLFGNSRRWSVGRLRFSWCLQRIQGVQVGR